MDTGEFIFDKPATELPPGIINVSAPSNIALVKYWGKHGMQLPSNPSLSFTLTESRTHTRIAYTPATHTSGKVEFDISYRGKPVPAFRKKTGMFFDRISPYVPFVKHYRWSIDTYNTFPHSSGIASSASAMAALAAGVMEIEKKINPGMSEEYLKLKTSFLARLGSGSASRSVSGPVMVWGEHPSIPGTSDLYAVPFPLRIHRNFEGYRDTILIIEEGVKQVSSTAGHRLMNGHPFAQARFEQANRNMERLSAILRQGDLDGFVQLVEGEALTLHALMMSSKEHYILMREGTLAVLHKTRKFRRDTGIPLCFTLDAGANVHLLYPPGNADKVSAFIHDELLEYTTGIRYIDDRMGEGITCR